MTRPLSGHHGLKKVSIQNICPEDLHVSLSVAGLGGSRGPQGSGNGLRPALANSP